MQLSTVFFIKKKCKHRLWYFKMHSWDMQPWGGNISRVNSFLTCKPWTELQMLYGTGQINKKFTKKEEGNIIAEHLVRQEKYCVRTSIHKSGREMNYQVGIRLLRYSSTAAVPFAKMAARGVRKGLPSKRSVLQRQRCRVILWRLFLVPHIHCR